MRSCILRFDGAARGNPGPAGAGAALFTENGILLYRFREGLGYQTNNAAEYHALILGLNQAFYKGFCPCLNWITTPYIFTLTLTHSNMSIVMFKESNTEADAQANRAINLREGQVEEEPVYY
ncbi:hypothetical protein P8452_37448 [Trifolium repens]|nr:hypothetical protein P8452_37448 [Trifolium repens]